MIEADARKNIVQMFRQKSEGFAKDPNQKNVRQQLQIDIRRGIQILATIQTDISQKMKTMFEIFQRAQNQSYEQFYFAVLTFADIVVEQCDTRIRTHQNAAYSFAILIIGLVQVERNLLELVLGILHEQCPYTIPVHYTPNQFDNDSELCKMALGYRENSETKIEHEDFFLERLRGYISLFAAILQFEKNPTGVEMAWSWLARMCNFPPNEETSTVLLSFLEVAGYRMLRVYPQQFPKILHFIAEEIIPKLDSKTQPRVAANARLKLFCEGYFKTKMIKEMEGRNPEMEQQSSTSAQVIHAADYHSTE